MYLRQSTASQEVLIGRFVDSTDGNTEETALTIANTDIKIWKTGATTLANKNSGGATHISNGDYYATLDATDTDTIGPLKISVHVAGALSVQVWCCVLDEAVYDALFGTTALATATNITAGTITTVTTLTGHTPQTGDSFARLGAPAGASVSADIAAVKVDTAATLIDTAEIGAAGAGLTAIPWNAAWDAEVQSEVDDALVAQRLDELLNADSDIDGLAPPTVGSVFHELMTKTAGSFTYDQTTDSIEAIRDRGDAAWTTATGFSTLTSGDVSTAVWDAATATYGSAGSYGLLVETNLADILTDTAEIGVAGAGLTNINLPNQTMDIIGNITGNLSGSVGSVTGLTASNLDATISSRATPAQVNTEVLDVLTVDTFAQPGQETPAATTTLKNILTYLYKGFRNRKDTTTAGAFKLYNDDATTVDQKSTLTDDGVTFTATELESGP